MVSRTIQAYLSNRATPPESRPLAFRLSCSWRSLPGIVLRDRRLVHLWLAESFLMILANIGINQSVGLWIDLGVFPDGILETARGVLESGGQ